MATMATATRTRKATTVKTTTPVEVVGRGFRKADHALVWMTTSQSEANRWHQVTQLANGQFACDCKSACLSRRPSCAHRDAVRMLLAVEEAEFQATHQPAITRTPTVPARTDDERATAPLSRDNKPFSIFKA